MAVIHTVKFERNTRTGLYRALCSCGWFLTGEAQEVQSRASCHDIEWEPVEPGNLKAPAPANA